MTIILYHEGKKLYNEKYYIQKILYYSWHILSQSYDDNADMALKKKHDSLLRLLSPSSFYTILAG